MVLSGRTKLNGIVEIDEVLIGGKKSGKRGRGAEGKSLIAIAIEVIGKKTGRIRLAKISNASAKNLNEFILENIELGATVITDGWPAYKNVNKLGYYHEVHDSFFLEDEEVLEKCTSGSFIIETLVIGYSSKLFE